MAGPRRGPGRIPEKPKNFKGTIGQLFRYLGRYRLGLALVLVLALASTAFGIVGPKNSPLSKYLDVELSTSMFNSSYFSDISAARLCELATVSILHSILALTRDEKQMEKGEEIAISIERKRMPVK